MPISPTLPTDGSSDWDVPLNAALTEIIDEVNAQETDIAAALTTAAAPELIRDTIGTALVAGTNVTITVDDGSNTITIDSSGGGSSPDASTTVKGIVELATTAEATTGTDTVRAVTPEGLKTVADTKAALSHVHSGADITSGTVASARMATASDTAQGAVELATTGEATTGTDTTRAVTAAGVKAVVDAHVALSDPHTQYLKETDAANYRDAVFSQGGTLTTGTGVFRLYNRSGVTRTIQTVTASVGTQPTGASILVDVNISGTTIFTTQSNRPTIAVSTNEDQSGTPDVTAWTSGSYLTIDIDQIGSTVAGANLTVTVVYS